MSLWREIFGFQPADQPSYDLAHERWQERAKAQKADPVKVIELGTAAEAEMWKRIRDAF